MPEKYHITSTSHFDEIIYSYTDEKEGVIYESIYDFGTTDLEISINFIYP